MSGTAKAKCLVAAVAISILLSAASYAQGIYIPVKPPHFPRRPFFTIKSQHADVTINDQAATTVIKQVFVNESRRDLEGTYIFPIPSGASVSAFSMWMNGKKVSGELLDADEARRIYI
ncbi:MAG: hypothetical protein KAX38_01855, partial [Candidatus Krumholzibacteria bacterium]|nr:hypothetical protein [Candidatus Krumholzibacteria bacterium]